MISFRRMICKLLGHRWDKHNIPYPPGQRRGCLRCYLIQWSEHVAYDGFKWKDLG